MTDSTILMLLQQDVAGLQAWLNSFEPAKSGRERRAWIGETYQYVVIEAMPLPDGYNPDEVDVLLLVDNYPSIPPIGIYLLNKGNSAVVRQLKNRFAAYRNQAFHDATAIEGYTWICYSYADNQWHYRANDLHRGDNLCKFMASFFAEALA